MTDALSALEVVELHILNEKRFNGLRVVEPQKVIADGRKEYERRLCRADKTVKQARKDLEAAQERAQWQKQHPFILSKKARIRGEATVSIDASPNSRASPLQPRNWKARSASTNASPSDSPPRRLLVVPELTQASPRPGGSVSFVGYPLALMNGTRLVSGHTLVFNAARKASSLKVMLSADDLLHFWRVTKWLRLKNEFPQEFRYGRNSSPAPRSAPS